MTSCLHSGQRLALSLCLIFCLSHFDIVAQKKSDFLYEISKTGQEKSYLFASLYQQEPSLFRVSDSVYTLLDQCKNVTFELDFDHLTDQFFAEIIDHTSKLEQDPLFMEFDIENRSDYLKQLQEQYELFKKQKPASTTKAKLPTLFDYMLRRVQHDQRTITGLLPTDDLMNEMLAATIMIGYVDSDKNQRIAFYQYLLINVFSKNLPFDKKILDIFKKGKLDDFESTVEARNYSWHTTEESRLNNLQMAVRMDSVMQTGRTFHALSIVNLLGENSIIHQLEKLGYSIRKIGSTYKNSFNEKYSKSVEKASGVVSKTIPNYDVTADFPIEPNKSNEDIAPTATYTCFDAPHLVTYFFQASYLLQDMSDDDFFRMKKLALETKEGFQQIQPSKLVETADGKCLEMLIKANKEYTYMRLYKFGRRIIFYGASSSKQATASSEDSKKFICSVKPLEVEVPDVTVNDFSNWSTF